MRLSDYIQHLGSEVDTEEYEKLGYVIYTNPDGKTYLAVRPDAPEEARHLASGASQGCDMSIALMDGDIVKAAYDGKEDVVKELLLDGVSPDTQNELGETALHNAAMVGFVNICALLLDHGASINITDKKGNTPLDIAIEWEDQAVSALLIGRGAKPHACISIDRLDSSKK